MLDTVTGLGKSGLVFSRKFEDFRNVLFFMIPFPVLCFLVS